MIRRHWFTVASVIFALVFAAAVLLVVAARAEMRWLREKFAEDQIAIFQENTRLADGSKDPRELASFLAATKFYYPSGTKQIPGTPLDEKVEAAPQVVTVSGDDGSEPDAFAADLLEGVLYVLDRNFLDFDFLIQLLGKNNYFVLRVRGNAPATRVLESRAITAADGEADVISDELVELTGRGPPAK